MLGFVALALILGATRATRSHSCADVALPGGNAGGRNFRFDLIRDSVYQAVSTGPVTAMSRPVVIIGDSDVTLIDATTSVAAACALLADLRTLTPKPVRTVVNTHFHFDHTNGNEAFAPGVEIVAHENAARLMSAGASIRGRAYDWVVGVIGGRDTVLQRTIDTTTSAARRDSLQLRLAPDTRLLTAIAAAVPTPATRTVSRELDLTRGSRTIRLLHFGPAHTPGDLVVFLPRERLVITGDLIHTNLAYLYMGDGFFPGWINVLDSVKALNFDVVVPAHQAPFRERERIDNLQSYLRDLWTQAVALHAQGESSAGAARVIDLRSHATQIAGAAAIGVDPIATKRIWELLDRKP